MKPSIRVPGTVQVVRAGDGASIARAVTLPRALSFGNARGLLGRDGLEPGEAVVIRDPLGSIHSFGMRFAFDAVFCDRGGRVLRVERAVGRRRVLRQRGARTIFELAAGEIERHRIRIGDVLNLTP